MDKIIAVCGSMWALSIITTNNSSQHSIGENNEISSFLGTTNFSSKCVIINDERELVHF